MVNTMKIQFILINLALALGLTNVSAGTFIADSKTEISTLDLHKIVFHNGNVDTYMKNGDMDSYEFSSVQRILYSSAPQETTSDEAIGIEDGVTVFPNPAKNSINISGVEEGENIKIMDITGQVLLTTKANSDKTEINVSRFSRGIYFIVAGENVIKFIKQ